MEKKSLEKASQEITQRTSGRIIAVTKWEEVCPEGPSLGTIRHYIFNGERNGFDSVLLKIGGRLFIDEDAFTTWAKSHRVSEGGTT